MCCPDCELKRRQTSAVVVKLRVAMRDLQDTVGRMRNGREWGWRMEDKGVYWRSCEASSSAGSE